MDEELTNSLRWVLLTTEETWRSEFTRAIDHLTTSRDGLEELRGFLEDKLPTAAPIYQQRMDEMISTVARLQASLGGDETILPELARAFARVDSEVQALEEALVARREERKVLEQRILNHLGEGGAIEIGGYRFARVPGKPAIDVVDRSRIPLHYCRPEPNVAALRRAYEQDGTAPDGTRVRPQPATLDVLKLSE